MGSDFLCTTFSWPMGKTAKGTDQNLKKELDKVKKRIERLFGKNLEERVARELSEEGEITLDCGISISKDKLIAALSDLEEGCLGNRRDAGAVSVGERVVLVTGGMSWGDDPTELFGQMQLLVDAGVLGED